MEAIAMMFRHEEYTDEPILTLTYVKAIAKWMFGSTRLDDRDIKDLLHLFLSGNSHLPLPFADSLDALQEKLNEYENNCPPILVSLEYPNG